MSLQVQGTKLTLKKSKLSALIMMSFEAIISSLCEFNRWNISASTAWPHPDMPLRSLGSSQHWSGDGASGFCTAAKSVGCYWYPISSVTPKLLCIQRLCTKPRVSSLWPVILTIWLAVLLRNNHWALYYPGNKSIASATLGAFQPWHFNCASLILGGMLTNLAIAVKFLTQ